MKMGLVTWEKPEIRIKFQSENLQEINPLEDIGIDERR
jgi:hypothetical protein